MIMQYTSELYLNKNNDDKVSMCSINLRKVRKTDSTWHFNNCTYINDVFKSLKSYTVFKLHSAID